MKRTSDREGIVGERDNGTNNRQLSRAKTAIPEPVYPRLLSQGVQAGVKARGKSRRAIFHRAAHIKTNQPLEDVGFESRGKWVAKHTPRFINFSGDLVVGPTLRGTIVGGNQVARIAKKQHMAAMPPILALRHFASPFS